MLPGKDGVPDPRSNWSIRYVLLNASDPAPSKLNLRPHSPSDCQLENNAVVKVLSTLAIVTVTSPLDKDQDGLVPAPQLIAELWKPFKKTCIFNDS